MELVKAEQFIDITTKGRDQFKEMLDWGEEPSVTKDIMLARWRRLCDDKQTIITADEKRVEELKEKVGIEEPAREQDDEKEYKISKTLMELFKARGALDKDIRDRAVYEKLRGWTEDHDVSKGEILKAMRSSLLATDKMIEERKVYVEELRKKVEPGQNDREVGVTGQEGEDKGLEAVRKGVEEQGKDIAGLKKGVAKNSEDIKKNTDDIKKNAEGINRLESKPPTAEHATAPESSKPVPNTHESPHHEAPKPESSKNAAGKSDPKAHHPPAKDSTHSVARVDHLNRQKSVEVLLAEKGKESVKKSAASGGASSGTKADTKPGPVKEPTKEPAKVDETGKAPESANVPSAPSNEAHHDVEAPKLADSQADSKLKAPVPTEPEPAKSDSKPAEHGTPPASSKPAGKVEVSPHADPKAPTDPSDAKSTKPQSKPADKPAQDESQDSKHEQPNTPPANQQPKPGPTDPQPKPDVKPASPPPTQDDKKPATATDHKDAAAHARLDEHDAQIGKVSNNLKEVKEAQGQATAKHSSEVTQLKENHAQQEVRIGKVETNQAKTDTELKDLKKDHGPRVDNLETDHDRLEDEVKTDIGILHQNLAQTNNRVASHETRIQDLQNQNVGFGTKFIDFDRKYTTLQTDFNLRENRISKHEEAIVKVPALEAHKDHATQDLNVFRDRQDTTIQDVHGLKVGLGQTQTDLKHTYEGLKKVDAKADKANTGLTDLQQRVTTLEVGKSDGPNWGLIIGGGIAAVVAVAGVVGGVFWWLKRKKAEKDKSAEGSGESSAVNVNAVEKGNGSKARQRLKANRDHARDWYPERI